MNILQIKNAQGQWVKIPAIQGNDGKSAYEVAVENGFTGTEEEWLESLKGSGGGVSDHNLLTGRDSNDQHPISAITGLEDILATIPVPMSAEQLREILKTGG